MTIHKAQDKSKISQQNNEENGTYHQENRKATESELERN